MPDEAGWLVIVAHADDEIIGAGNLLAGLPEGERRRTTIAYLTDSAPRDPRFARAAGFKTREAYAAARRHEREAALEIAGIPADQCCDFGFVDQESCFHLVEITRRIVQLVHEVRPAIVLTHPYEGGHPDHDAAAFTARQALSDPDGPGPVRLVEFASYHAVEERLETGRFLFHKSCPEEVVRLNDTEQARKRAMFACHQTQAAVLAQFRVTEERFRPAPKYDFCRPPHAGTLHYERLNWGISGEQWREEARQATELLHRCNVWD